MLQANGAVASTPHPIDLLISAPLTVILEVKTLGARPALFAVRKAVGQFLEYRHFRGPHDAKLGILLEDAPGQGLTTYVEDILGLFLLWKNGNLLVGGPKSAAVLAAIGVRYAGT